MGMEPWAGAAGAAALPFGRMSGREESPPPTAALSDGGPLPPLSLPLGFTSPHTCAGPGDREEEVQPGPQTPDTGQLRI